MASSSTSSMPLDLFDPGTLPIHARQMIDLFVKKAAKVANPKRLLVKLLDSDSENHLSRTGLSRLRGSEFGWINTLTREDDTNGNEMDRVQAADALAEGEKVLQQVGFLVQGLSSSSDDETSAENPPAVQTDAGMKKKKKKKKNKKKRKESVKDDAKDKDGDLASTV